MSHSSSYTCNYKAYDPLKQEVVIGSVHVAHMNEYTSRKCEVIWLATKLGT